MSTTTAPIRSTTDHAPEPANARTPDGHRWQTAGDAWGRRARDWACLFEHYATDVIAATLPRLGVGPGTSLLDVACGSGLAARIAAGTGARVAGIDAAEPLVAIGRERAPEVDLRVGDMFDLPWADDAFDAVTSYNGIWGGCEGALAEAARVLRPGGRIAITYWGDGHLDLRPCFLEFALHAPADHQVGMKRTNAISRPGVAEAMLTHAGFEVLEVGSRVSTMEWSDPDTAWRAISSLGPAVPALEAVGPDVLEPKVMAAMEELRDRHGIYRFRNDHRFVVARLPR